jgi:predicted RNA-binding Zn ribbon-like protein
MPELYGGTIIRQSRPVGLRICPALDVGGRVRVCDAPGCDAVLIDLSRNRSRRYCDTGNCGNRQHVAAYRARRAT